MALEIERSLGDIGLGGWDKAKAALVAVVFLLAGVWICLEALQVPFGSFRMPGAGFFPLLLGMTLGLLSLVLLAISLLGDPGGVTQVTPTRAEILYLIGTMFASVWLFERAGYLLTMVFFLGLALKMLGKTGWLVAVAIALVGSVASYLIFGRLLMIALPSGILPF